MEEQEIPTEQLQDQIHEKAEESMKEERDRWGLYVALSTACIAVLAAIAGLLSGHHANEAVIDQIKSSDQWNFYQAKSIKAEIAGSTEKILHATAAPVKDAANGQASARYEKEKEEIKKVAEEDGASAEKHLATHVTYSKAVTIFQIAIAISAISILTRKRILWYGGVILSLVGIIFMLMGLFS
jgi:Domain of unknown function (DUF4337)